MSYKVLARKYRPQCFDDVVGQEHVTRTLTNAINSDRVAHAYLFSGPRGTGKTTIARIFAKALNATDGPTVDFKDEDERCIEISEGRSLDVLEIDGASNNGVEQVRELRDTAPYAPAACRFKIYIIDEVHMLTTAAFNALLKTLEEPPAHVKFLFATTEPEKVLPTILSRCQRFDLRRLTASQIVSHLDYVSKKEGVSIETAALQAIARGADGGMRDAESTLDQLISFCGENIEERDVLSMFGLSSQDQVISMSTAILQGEAQSVLTEFSGLVNSGKELPRLIGDLLNHFRNLMIFQLSKGDLSVLEVSEAESDALSAQSKLVDPAAVPRVLEVLTDCEIRLRNAASKRILVEVSLMKAIDSVRAMSLNDVLDELQQLKEVLPAHEIANNQKVSAISKVKSGDSRTPTTIQKGSQKTQQVAGEEKTEIPVNTDLRELWAKMMESLGIFSRAYFQEAFLKSYKDGVVNIGFPEKFAPQMELADTRDINRTLIDALSKSGRDVRAITYVVAERPDDWVPLSVDGAKANGQSDVDVAASTKPLEGPVDMEEFKNDPLIKKALDVFKGQIVDVRT